MDKNEQKIKAKKAAGLRKAVQAGWGILSNAYIKGFLPGDPVIYQGKLKQVCVPGMNCYSCPGALGSCPIGSLQAIFDNRHRGIGAYVIGYLAIIGLFIGRFICAWLCLFGLIQELLYKIPTPKLTVPEKIDRPLRYLKYVMLFVMVFLLPFFYRSKYGVGEPFFCKYICPVPGRNAGRRDTAGPSQQHDERGSGLALQMEVPAAFAVHRSIDLHLQAVLQIHLPFGSFLRALPEGEPDPHARGQGEMRGLRYLRKDMQNECRSAQDA